MAAIRSRDTRAEVELRGELRRRGLTGYRCNHRKLPGKPDIAYTRWKLAIFVDGAFWHGHPEHFTFGQLEPYWDEKVRKTQKRDRDQETALREAGYTVIRFWDFDVRGDLVRCADVVEAELMRAGRDPGEAS